MRPAVLLLLAVVPLSAQTTDIQTALLNEVHELRLAIERSTLLGTRTQLAISQLQLQDAAVARVAQQLNEVKGIGPGSNGHIAQLTDQVKRLDELRTSPEWASPAKHEEFETLIRRTKGELEMATAYEQQRSARESEIAIQLQTAQAQAADARARIAQMEQALDAAIQQLLKPH